MATGAPPPGPKRGKVEAEPDGSRQRSGGEAGTGRAELMVCTLIAVLVAVAAIGSAATAAAQSCGPGAITGEVTHVPAGDILEVDGQPIRLQGLAAPERNEPGGEAAAEALRRMVEGRTVLCELTGERTDDHCVGVCYTEVDVSALLVRRGLARDCPRLSGGRYAEAEARAAGEGAMIREIYPLPAHCLQR